MESPGVVRAAGSSCGHALTVGMRTAVPAGGGNAARSRHLSSVERKLEEAGWTQVRVPGRRASVVARAGAAGEKQGRNTGRDWPLSSVNTRRLVEPSAAGAAGESAVASPAAILLRESGGNCWRPLRSCALRCPGRSSGMAAPGAPWRPQDSSGFSPWMITSSTGKSSFISLFQICMVFIL